MYNLSSKPLDADEIAVLCLGPKYVPTTPSTDEQVQIDILNFSRTLLLKAMHFDNQNTDTSLIYPVSSFCPKMTSYPILKNIVTELEALSRDDLNRRMVDDNMSQQERRGLDKLLASEHEMYITADKGGAPVWLDRDFYQNLMEKALNTPTYEKLDDNRDYFTNIALQGLTRKYKHMLTKKERLAITNFDYKRTNIYGVPKLHKSKLLKAATNQSNSPCLEFPRPADLDLRIIFGGPKNPTTGLAALVDALLKPFLPKVTARVQDVFDFINKLPKIKPEDLPFIEMWSVDVKNMYPSIDHVLGLKAIAYWMDQYPALLPSRFSKEFVLEILHFVLENNTGYFNGSFYRQRIGTATGIKPAGTYADLTMGYLETILFTKLKISEGQKVAHYFWRHYRRYLDDGQIMWDTRLGSFENVFSHMNSLHPMLKFTCEHDREKLVYLDVTILKCETGIETEIYNKETDVDTILPHDSCHPRHTVKAIPFNLARRVVTLTDDPARAAIKLEALRAKLIRCRYPVGLVDTAISSARQLQTSELRKAKRKEWNDQTQSLTFVHTYDPTLPDLVPQIKDAISRIYTSREVKHIFGKTRFINSQREPQNLERLLHRPCFEDPSLTNVETGNKKCGFRNCRCCQDILEVDSLYFRNSDIDFKIKKPMSCITRNLIYATICKKCGFTYIGETVNLRSRMNTHRSSSNSRTAATQENSRHLYKCGEGFWVCPLYKVGDESLVARLVKENKLINLLQPDLNRDQRNILQLK